VSGTHQHQNLNIKSTHPSDAESLSTQDEEGRRMEEQEAKEELVQGTKEAFAD
jgi:hypothetical protein